MRDRPGSTDATVPGVTIVIATRARFRRGARFLVLSSLLLAGTLVSAGSLQKAPASAGVRPEAVRAEMEFLASDALAGRGSGTQYEQIAATYVASQLRQYGIEPAGDGGGYVQTVHWRRRSRKTGEEETGVTWNVVGVLRGSKPGEAVLLSAHIDHLGTDPALKSHQIYNGADDDASGVTAVLELARVLANAHKIRRTVYFSFFGSEEPGGLGSEYFREHPPVPLDQIVANLEFEMIGRPDPAVAPGTLWLTGYDRSNLGHELTRHGARLVADPHPEQGFFMRSDNYVLARRGVVAHTVSSFGLHKDYHQPSDVLARIDFNHLMAAIASMLPPVIWLVNSDFQPQWVEGKKP